MKKLLLTLLLLASTTSVMLAQAITQTWDFKVTQSPESGTNATTILNNTTNSDKGTWTFIATTTYAQNVTADGPRFGSNKNPVQNGATLTLADSDIPANATITNVTFSIKGASNTAQSKWYVSVGENRTASQETVKGSTPQTLTWEGLALVGNNIVINIDGNATGGFNLQGVSITYTNIGGTKIDLDAANLIVSAGEQTLEGGESYDLDKNTAITFKYQTTEENADITYSYSTDGSSYTDGNSYMFTGENDVTLTVKAESNNAVTKTITLNKWYPTECPAPVFSVTDGAEVYAGQVISVSCDGAEELYLEANDQLLDGTSYTVSGEIGSTITLHALASVTGKNGSINNETTITVTVVERTEATFDFADNTYGLTPQSNSTRYEADETNPVTELNEGIVTINLTGEKYRYWSSDKTLRVQSGSTFTISVPENYYITSIHFTGTSTSANPDKGTLSYGNYTPGDLKLSSVKFSPSATLKLEAITVHYALRPAEIVELVPGEIKYKATVASLDYELLVANHKEGTTYTVTLTVTDSEGTSVSETNESHTLVADEEVAMSRAAAPTRLSGTIGLTGLKNSTVYTAEISYAVKGEEATAKTMELPGFTTNATGIEDVTIDGNEAAVYYNLQGVRVAEPQAGQIYIVRRGAKATKELVK